jgi:hypothetical protein
MQKIRALGKGTESGEKNEGYQFTKYERRRSQNIIKAVFQGL